MQQTWQDSQSFNEQAGVTKPIRLALAEDHMLTRIGLRHSLKKYTQIDIVAEAEDGQEIIGIAEAEHPDLILMDLSMPVMDGIVATRHIKAAFPGIRVLILTSYQNKAEVLAALTAGADGYCMKDIQPLRLVQAIEMVHDGVLWIDPAVAHILLEYLNQPVADKSMGHIEKSGRSKGLKLLSPLTKREYEILVHIVNGKSNREIAEVMELSIYTVKGHVCTIIQKMSVDDRTQAAVKALRMGLVEGI